MGRSCYFSLVENEGEERGFATVYMASWVLAVKVGTGGDEVFNYLSLTFIYI